MNIELGKAVVFLRNKVPEKILLDGHEISNCVKASYEINPGEVPKLILTIDCDSISVVNQP